MELLIILLLVGFGIYQLLRFNMRNGAEAVRAHLFLSLLHDGMSVEEARHMTDIDVSELDPRITANAVSFIREHHDGKQLPIIRNAYRKGMNSRLPGWYRSFSGLR